LIGKKGPEKTGMRLENQLMSRRTITKSGVAITLSSGQSREKKRKNFKNLPKFFFSNFFFVLFSAHFQLFSFCCSK